MPRTGVTQWFLEGPQSPESLKFAQGLGFDCIHINAGMPLDRWYIGKSEVVREYHKMVEKWEIPITAISVNLIEHHGLMISRSNELEHQLREAIQKTIDAAKQLNVRLIYFPSFNQSLINNSDDFNKTAKILQFACDFAGQSAVQIATENTLSPIENAMLIQKVDRPNLKLLLDTLNPILWGHSVLEFIDTLFPFFADQIHVKDGIRGKAGSARLGFGEAGLQSTIDRLYERGFVGTFILENDYLHNGTELIQEDLSLLSSMCCKSQSKREYVLC